MTPGIVCFHCTAASGVTVRAYLNDLPVFKRTRQGHLTMQGGANQFMLPGENELVLEVLRAPRPRSTGAPPGEALRFAVYTADDPVNAPKDVRFLHDLHYASQILEPNLATEEEPYCYRARFPVDVPVVTPRYRSADVVEVGCRGTPELHAVVAELHDVVARADVDAFLDLHAVRMAEYARAYGSFGPASMATQIQDARTFFGAGVVEAQDLAPERLHFESRAGGRVVFVSRLDEEPAIGARAGQELLKGNLWLARFEQSRWTLVG